MKKAANIVGYITALLLFTTIFMKSNHLPGAGTIMALSGIFISIYLPFYLLYKPTSEKKSKALIMGAASASVLNLGITFKFQHWPGSNVTILLGLTTFAFAFVPMLLSQEMKKDHSDRKTIMNMLGATGLTLFSLGLLFKLMHWPGAGVMLGISVIFLFFGYFLLYLLDKSIDSDVKSAYLRKAFFSIIIGSIVATCLLLDLNRPWFKPSPEQAMLEKTK